MNAAGAVDFNTRLDRAIDTNVRGTLKLMQLAEQCSHLDCFAHVSTTFSLCDKVGFIDEKSQPGNLNWEGDLQRIMNMTSSQI